MNITCDLTYFQGLLKVQPLPVFYFSEFQPAPHNGGGGRTGVCFGGLPPLPPASRNTPPCSEGERGGDGKGKIQGHCYDQKAGRRV